MLVFLYDAGRPSPRMQTPATGAFRCHVSQADPTSHRHLGRPRSAARKRAAALAPRSMVCMAPAGRRLSVGLGRPTTSKGGPHIVHDPILVVMPFERPHNMAAFPFVITYIGALEPLALQSPAP